MKTPFKDEDDVRGCFNYTCDYRDVTFEFNCSKGEEPVFDICEFKVEKGLGND